MSSASETDRSLSAAILSSIPAHVAVLDRQGVILAVNEAWTAFALANGVSNEASIAPGASYLQVCERAAAEGVPGAARAFDGIKAVCEGRRETFDTKYVCARAGLKQWFALKVVRLRRPEGGAVISHRDISNERRQEIALRDLSGRLIDAQEAERRRLARELHDDVQQRLALLAIELDGIALGRVEISDGQIRERARDLLRQTVEISTDIRNLSSQLHPAKLEALGLVATVQAHCRDLSQRGLDVTFTHDSMPRTIPDDVALCAFRVVQESLQNVVKHSGATKAHVTMCGANGLLRVEVEDDGSGFDVDEGMTRGGLGLASMLERLHLIGGTMMIRSSPGAGTSVEFEVPLQGRDPQEMRA